MTETKKLVGDRLVLIASTATHVRTELETPERLSSLLDANVSPEWPSGEYDRDAMEFFLARFEEDGEAAQGWYGWYALGPERPENPDGPRALVGSGGYFGPPDADGTVEIGYSVLPEWQRRGYASEMVEMLVARALTFVDIQRVIAHTGADNLASVGVLVRCSFAKVEGALRDGKQCFERRRGLRRLAD